MTTRYKYPRTPHLPFSPAYNFDEEQLANLACFDREEIVITEKMDGENTTLYGTGGWHARGLDNNRKHESRDWIANYWSNKWGTGLSSGWRICGENLYAKHSIQYNDLIDYFYGISVWDENNICKSWNETVVLFDSLGIPPVPTLYQGKFSFEAMTGVAAALRPDQEGFVMRLAGEFDYQNFSSYVAKWVRANHVQTPEKHWFASKVVKNKKRV